MPRLDGDMESHNIGKGGFAFTGARLEKLEATDYTLVTIALDKTGSVSSFVSDLENMERAAIAGCKKSPRSENIMVRLIRFSSSDPSGIEEVCGFMPLNDIDVNTLPPIRAFGGTPLYDAAYSSIAATVQYGKQLRDNDFGVNSILFIITDGDDNCSKFSRAMVKQEQEKAISGEQLESHISILIGVNAQQYRTYLEQFQREAGLTQYVDVVDATPQKLAKLADFVSRSVSSQSQAMGTGGPSQNIDPTI